MKSLTFLSFSLVLTTVLGNPLQKRANSVKFENCDEDRTRQINESLEDVERLSAAATRESEGGGGKFSAWFGDGAGQGIADESINIRYHKFSNMRSNVPKKDVTFNCTTSAQRCCSAGTGTVPACGEFAGDDYIQVCPGFWSWYQKKRIHELAPPKGPTNVAINRDYRTRSYVLLHELLHSQYKARDVVDWVKDPFGKSYECKGYGQICVLKYARNKPDNARRNADTYALFALASYYGINNFQTDPDQVVD